PCLSPVISTLSTVVSCFVWKSRVRMPIVRSLNHLIRPQQQRWRDREAKGLGGLEVDDKLEPRRLLDWEVRRLRALKNPIDVYSCPPIQVPMVRAIRHQPPRQHVFLDVVDRWQAVSCSKGYDSVDVELQHGITGHDQRGGTLLRDQTEGGIHFRSVADHGRDHIKPQSRRGSSPLAFEKDICGIVRVPDHAHALGVRKKLLHQFKALGSCLSSENRGPGDISARSSQITNDRLWLPDA